MKTELMMKRLEELKGTGIEVGTYDEKTKGRELKKILSEAEAKANAAEKEKAKVEVSECQPPAPRPEKEATRDEYGFRLDSFRHFLAKNLMGKKNAMTPEQLRNHPENPKRYFPGKAEAEAFKAKGLILGRTEDGKKIFVQKEKVA